MILNEYGEGIDIPAPEWVTDQVAYLIMRAKEDLPADYLLQTINKEFGLAIYVNSLMFERYTVEQRVSIARRLNILRDEIEETGCPTWIDKY